MVDEIAYATAIGTKKFGAFFLWLAYFCPVTSFAGYYFCFDMMIMFSPRWNWILFFYCLEFSWVDFVYRIIQCIFAPFPHYFVLLFFLFFFFFFLGLDWKFRAKSRDIFSAMRWSIKYLNFPFPKCICNINTCLKQYNLLSG